MSISFACPECRAQIEVADEHAGLAGQCPRCQQVIDIPSPTKPVPILKSAEAAPAAPREERAARRRVSEEQDEPERPRRIRPAPVPARPSAPIWAWLVGIFTAVVTAGLLISSFAVLVFWRPSQPTFKKEPMKQQAVQPGQDFQRVTLGQLDGNRAFLQNGRFQVQSRLSNNDPADPRSDKNLVWRTKLYRIDLQANRTYRLTHDSPHFAGFIRITDPRGNPQAWLGGDGERPMTRDFRPTMTGEHTIHISSANPAVGDFTLTITDLNLKGF